MSYLVESTPSDLGFNAENVILPVIHTVGRAQALRAASIIESTGAEGCFIINHHESMPITVNAEELLEISEIISEQHDLKVGVNILGMTFPDIVEKMETEEIYPFALWHDGSAKVREHDLDDLHSTSAKTGKHVTRFFGGVAFKYLDYTDDPNLAADMAEQAIGRVDVVTTSGPGTNKPEGIEKIAAMSQKIAPVPLAIASGVNLQNIAGYMPYVDYFIVGSSVETHSMSGEINAFALKGLLEATKRSPE